MMSWTPPKVPPVTVVGRPWVAWLLRFVWLYRAATSQAPHPPDVSENGSSGCSVVHAPLAIE